jgi:hypothetical protein
MMIGRVDSQGQLRRMMFPWVPHELAGSFPLAIAMGHMGDASLLTGHAPQVSPRAFSPHPPHPYTALVFLECAGNVHADPWGFMGIRVVGRAALPT